MGYTERFPVDPQLLALGGLWYVAFLLSLTCHEAAHALVAQWGGDDTAAAGGQLTLNPLPHVRREPLGTIAVPLLTFALQNWMLGWASAPYSPLWEHRHPHRAGWMALAGPAANLVLALAAAVLINIGLAMGAFDIPASITFFNVVEASGDFAPLAQFLSILFTQNVLLMTFNLLPVPPLDGNTVIGLLMPEHAARRWFDITRDHAYSLLGLLLAWYFFGEIFWPILRLAVRLLYWV